MRLTLKMDGNVTSRIPADIGVDRGLSEELADVLSSVLLSSGAPRPDLVLAIALLTVTGEDSSRIELWEGYGDQKSALANAAAVYAGGWAGHDRRREG